MKSTPKKRIKPFTLFRLLGIVAFVVVLWNVDFSKVVKVLRDIDIKMLGFAVLFQIILLIIKSIRWHIMNDGRKQSKYWIRSTGRFFESYSMGVITPGRLGEVMKAGHEKGVENKLSATLRVISERGFDVSIFVILAVISFYLIDTTQINFWILILVFIAGMALLVISFLLLGSPWFLSFIQHFIRKMHHKVSIINLVPLENGYSRVGMILFLSILSNLSYFISCWFLSKSVHLDLSFLLVSGGVAIAGLLNMLPITIAGLGTREVTFLTLFNMVAKSSVLAFSFMMLLVAQIGGGLISLILGQLLLWYDKRNSN